MVALSADTKQGALRRVSERFEGLGFTVAACWAGWHWGVHADTVVLVGFSQRVGNVRKTMQPSLLIMSTYTRIC